MTTLISRIPCLFSLKRFRHQAPPFFFVVALIFGLPNCGNPERNAETLNAIIPEELSMDTMFAEPAFEQIIVAHSQSWKAYEGILYGMEIVDGYWAVSYDTVACTFGKKGIAQPDEKVEGDGKTPTGIFQVGSAFGYRNDLTPSLNFIELSDNHYWISDSSSPEYNKLVDFFPKGLNHEKMLRNDHLYKYGIIIEYNTAPVIQGKGSAIFIHVQRKEGAPTAGCIALSEKNMKHLIKWVKPEKHPVIIIGIKGEPEIPPMK